MMKVYFMEGVENKIMITKENDLSKLWKTVDQLSEVQKLEFISILSAQLVTKQHHKDAKLKTKTWMSMAGLGAEIWKNEDAQEYVWQERASWID